MRMYHLENKRSFQDYIKDNMFTIEVPLNAGETILVIYVICYVVFSLMAVE
jgi:hypothetical protein